MVNNKSTIKKNEKIPRKGQNISVDFYKKNSTLKVTKIL